MLERLFSSILKRMVRLQRRQITEARAFRHYKQAMAARDEGVLDEAETHYRSAIELDPDAHELYYNLGLLLQEVGEMNQAVDLFQRVLSMRPALQSVHSSLLCTSDFSMAMTRDEIYSLHVRWAQRFADPLTDSESRPRSSSDDRHRLKIGFVSADFRRHAVGRFLEPVLNYLDTSRYEIICYNNTDVSDDMSTHLRSLVEEWRDIHAISDQDLAAMVRRDNVDVLIDLSGHSLGNRLLMFARKPAPVQLSWLGYLNTTGMKAMDFRLTDAVSDPPGTDKWYREKLLRMPHAQWCYVPMAGPVAAPITPVVPRQTNHTVVFACMTRFMKITDAAVELWIQILDALPDSKLRIVDVPAHYRGRDLHRRFDNAGLGARVELMPTLFGMAYWNAFDGIDVALDTFPYTGATTTCDCLWMGVPVVTLAGPCGAARSASSLLASLDLHELIANTVRDYVAIAVKLGGDRLRLENLRGSLRDRMKCSPICDPYTFTRNFEQQLDIAWNGWREKRMADG